MHRRVDLYRRAEQGEAADTNRADIKNDAVEIEKHSLSQLNNDGNEDVFITYWGHNVLYRNNGDGTFTDVTKEAGLLGAKPSYGSGCTWVDYDRDGKLDLFVANYLDFDLARTPKPGDSSNCNWKGV